MRNDFSSVLFLLCLFHCFVTIGVLQLMFSCLGPLIGPCCHDNSSYWRFQQYAIPALTCNDIICLSIKCQTITQVDKWQRISNKFVRTYVMEYIQ